MHAIGVYPAACGLGFAVLALPFTVFLLKTVVLRLRYEQCRGIEDQNAVNSCGQ